MKNLPSVLVWAVVISLLVCASYFFSGRPTPPPPSTDSFTAEQERLLDVIWALESGRRFEAPQGAAGEIGPLQISHNYFVDASSVDGYLALSPWTACEDLQFSRRVVSAYMRRWVPQAWATGNAEVVLRTHVGGPRGISKTSSLQYWNRGRRLLEQ